MLTTSDKVPSRWQIEHAADNQEYEVWGRYNEWQKEERRKDEKKCQSPMEVFRPNPGLVRLGQKPREHDCALAMYSANLANNLYGISSQRNLTIQNPGDSFVVLINDLCVCHVSCARVIGSLSANERRLLRRAICERIEHRLNLAALRAAWAPAGFLTVTNPLQMESTDGGGGIVTPLLRVREVRAAKV